MEPTTSHDIEVGLKPAEPTKKKLSKHIIAAIVAVIVLVICITGLVLSGVMFIGFKTPGQRVVVQPQICGGTLISEYNKALQGADMQTIASNLKDLATQVNKKANNATDPNCQLILYYANFSSRDFEAALANAKNLQKLSTQGQFIDSSMSGLTNTDLLVQSIQSLLNNSLRN